MIRLALLLAFFMAAPALSAKAADTEATELSARIELLLLERDRLFRDILAPPKSADDTRIAEVTGNRRVDLVNLVLAMLGEASARERALLGDRDGISAWRDAAQRLANLEAEILEREYDRVQRLAEAGFDPSEALIFVNRRLSHARQIRDLLKTWVARPPASPKPLPYALPSESLSSALIQALAQGDWIEETINKAMADWNRDRQGLLRGTYDKAMAAAKAGDRRRATDLMERVRLFSPETPQVLWNLALLSDQLGVRPQIAAAWYEAFAAASEDGAAAGKARVRAEELRQSNRRQWGALARRGAELLPQIPERDRTGRDAATDAMVVYALGVTGAESDALRLARAATDSRADYAISYLSQSYAIRGRIGDALAGAKAASGPVEAASWLKGLSFGLAAILPSAAPLPILQALPAVSMEADRTSNPNLATEVIAAYTQLGRRHSEASVTAVSLLSRLPADKTPNKLVLVELIGNLAATQRLDLAEDVLLRIPDDNLERAAAECTLAAGLPPAHAQAANKAAACRLSASRMLDKSRAADPGWDAHKQDIPRDVMTMAWAASERKHGGVAMATVTRDEIRNRWFKMQADYDAALAEGNSRRAAILGWSAIASALPYSRVLELNRGIKAELLDLPHSLTAMDRINPANTVQQLGGSVMVQLYCMAFQEARMNWEPKR